MTDNYSKEVPDLMQSHLDHLLKSAITLDVIKERGYRSVFGAPELQQLGFKKRQIIRPVSGILIPLHGVNGVDIFSYQWRPDHPREEVRDDGKIRKIKYENPAGGSVRIDVPPRCKPQLGDPTIPLFITEGSKKGDAIASAGGCVIVLTGVFGFKGRNVWGGVTVLADFDNIAWKDRLVYPCFDSDSTSNFQVYQALLRLSEIVKRKGARPRLIKLPPGPNGEKVGADDYLAQGHTLNDLIGCEAKEDIKPPSNKKLDIFGNPYNLAEGILTFEKQNERGEASAPIALGNFSAIISEVIEKDNGKDITKFFKIVGRESIGKPLPEVIVPCKEFESLDWVVENWDVRAAISADRSAKSRIREALLLLSYNAVRKSIYSHTGWREFNGKRTFLTSGGAIGMPEIAVDMEDEDLADYNLPQPVADPTEALKASFDFLKIGNREVLLPLWAAMYMTPLNEFVIPSFTLFLEGLSGSFKSGVNALALNHFGKNFNYDHLPASWFYSENRLEQMLFTIKDLPLVIDDFAPAKDVKKAKEMEQMADRIIRNQANRSGRGRMKSDISVRKTYKPRGFLITSGEHLPGTYSAAARMYVIEIRKGDIDRVKFFQALEHKELYSQSMTQFLMWIIKNWDKLKAELPKQVQKWTTQALNEDKEQHARMPGAVANLYAGLTTALTFFVELKIITQNEAEALCREGWEAFIRQSTEQAERVNQERPGRRFIQLLSALKDQGRATFVSTEDEEPPKPIPGITVIGWSDKEAYYLNPEVAYAAARKFSENTDAPFTVKEDAVWRDLKELGYSDCMEGRTKYRKDIYREKKWLIRIKAGVL